jgi:hypothetical protein
LTDFTGEELRDNIKKDRLSKGVILHTEMTKTVNNKIDEIKSLKSVIERRDKIISDMRSQMLSEIIHLRESLFRRKSKLQPYRADQFNTMSMLTPEMNEIIISKINDAKEKYQEEIEALQKRLEEQGAKLQYYLDMDGKNNPGFSSLLIKRAIEGLKGDRHMVWKVL